MFARPGHRLEHHFGLAEHGFMFILLFVRHQLQELSGRIDAPGSKDPWFLDIVNSSQAIKGLVGFAQKALHFAAI